MDDEKAFDMRDRIALEVLNGIIANSKNNNELNQELLHYLTYTSDSDPAMKKSTEAHAAKRMETIIRNCYKVADIMRKVRLSTFE